MISKNKEPRSLETKFLIVICCPTGDKGQTKTLFSGVCDPHSSIVWSVSNCHLSGMLKERILW